MVQPGGTLPRADADFVDRLPTHARMEEALLKQTAAERFPGVCGMEGATDGGPPGERWSGRKLDEHAARIRKKLHRDLRHRKGGGWMGRRLNLAHAPHPVSPRRFLVGALQARSLLRPQLATAAPFPSEAAPPESAPSE